jgi:hypothetical protein
MTLTWKKLKELIDNKISESGKDDSIEIDYFDFNSYDNIDVYVVEDTLTVH